jgi:hypothetical protein
MKRYPLTLGFFAAVSLFLSLVSPARADSEYSPQRLDELDQLGLFTPAFKAAVHDMVETKLAIAANEKQQKQISQQLPDLQKQAADAEAKVVKLREQLVDYDHTDESDFAALQKKMSDDKATFKDQMIEAQTFVWAYPTSLHLADAQKYLQQLQKKQADLTQADKDAEAAREAARAKLLQRVQAKDLSLNEWSDFLRDMSQEDVLKYLGHPQLQNVEYWSYTGDWTVDPGTQQKAGLLLYFNGTRVQGVTPAPHTQ